MLDEKILHFVWKMKLLPVASLHTVTGETLEIQQVGMHNQNAGPDFLQAKIKIGETIWSGHVEIHVRSSDWQAHQHTRDKKYKNTILHVVYEDDAHEPLNFPTLELKKYIPSELLVRYRILLLDQHKIPCESLISMVSAFDIRRWMERMMIERLENKAEEILTLIQSNKGHIEDAFYKQLFKYLGKNTNQTGFEMLTSRLPLKILVAHKHHLHQLEALLYGQAGFLNAPQDEYTRELQKEYAFLAHKYSLQAMESYHWNFARMRPTNFPTVLLAIAASLLHHSSHLFTRILHCKDVDEMKKLFQVNASHYWDTHYQLNTTSEKSMVKKLGKSSIDILIINVALPFMYAHGKRMLQEEYCQRALDMLESLPAEQNQIIKQWQLLNLPAENAGDTQALIQLKRNYCDAKKCLDCGIGLKILKGS